MGDRVVATKAELVSDINARFGSLKDLIGRLSKEQLTSLRDSNGWIIKDHLAHLSAWEESAIFFFRGRPRHLALQVDEMIYLHGTEDEINELVRARFEQASPDEVITQLEEVNQQLLGVLAGLDDDDLRRPYSHYLPDEPGEGGDRPAINVAYGNSAHHFQEHHEWIEAMIQGTE